MGDKDKRTRSNMGNLLITLGLIALFLFSIIFLIGRFYDYSEYKKYNTTPIGTELEFSKTKAKVHIGSVWTDKNRDVTMIQLKYDKGARNQLSTKGKNYRLYLVSEEEGKPDVEMQYGILGTQGDGFLFIKGDLGERAYQVFIANQVELADNDDVDDGEGNDLTVDSNPDEITDSQMEKALSESEGADEDGQWSFGKDSEEQSEADNIDFRVNAYSEKTKVYNGSFLTDDGEIDYGKIINQSNVKEKLKDINDQIDEREKRDKNLHSRLEEFESRAKDNKEDDEAKGQIKETKEDIQENKERLDVLKKMKDRYEHANFNKDDFGEMQEHYKFDVEKLKN